MAGGLASEPAYKIREFVEEIEGRRDAAFDALKDEIAALVTGLLDQFAMRAKHDPNFSLAEIRFERPTWMRDSGKLVIDITYRGRPLVPTDHRMW